MIYSNKLKSNLIGKEYEYKTVNLLELREELIKQEGLSRLDIIKGYHTNSEIKLSYDYQPMYEDKKVKDKVVEVLTKAAEIQKMYIVNEFEKYIVETFESVKKKIEDKLEGSSYQKMVNIDDVLDVNKYYNTDKTPLKTILGVDIVNELDKLCRNYRGYSSVPRGIEEESKKRAVDFINKELSEYGLFTNGSESTFYYHTLPDKLQLDKEDIKDFDGYCYNTKEEIISNKEVGAENTYGFCHIRWEHEFPYIGVRRDSFSPITCVMKKLSKEEAKKLFEKSLDDALAKESSVSPMKYYQELESNPITISKDTESGKITLVDGYKRLLYITDKNLLDKDVTIRVFKDLSDKDLLTLLFMENSWKVTQSRNNEVDFHDRGFLFCLKQRFGIEYSETLMKVLYLYDRTGHLNCDITMNKALFSTPSIGDVRDIATKNDHYVKDIQTLTKFLDEIKEKSFPYEDNIKTFVAMTVVSLTGYVRRKEEFSNLELTTDMLEEAMVTDEVLKAFKKKKYSSDTYIENNFRDNHLAKALESKLKTLLECGKELVQEDTEMEM